MLRTFYYLVPFLLIGLLTGDGYAVIHSEVNLRELLPRDQKLIVVLLGPPGAGKGTQGSLLARDFGIPHISPGQLLRNEVAAQTVLGTQASALMKAGKFVPSDLILDVVFRRVSEEDAEQGYILDGFPRTTELAKAFMAHQYAHREEGGLDLQTPVDPPLLIVFNFTTSREVVTQRLTHRRLCQKCEIEVTVQTNDPQTIELCSQCGQPVVRRPDDHEEAIYQRFDLYVKNQADLEQSLFSHFSISTATIDAEQQIESIHEQIITRILEVLLEKRVG